MPDPNQAVDFSIRLGIPAYARIAFVGVIVIWSTTPLAIKWSAEAFGFSLAVTSRMVIGTALLCLISGVLGRPLPLHPRAVLTYLAAADAFSWRGSLAIVYLGVCGSVIGFLMYYHALKHMQASQVALLALITPVTALWLGYTFNNEPVTVHIWLGTLLILTGMMIYQWGRPLLHRLWRCMRG